MELVLPFQLTKSISVPGNQRNLKSRSVTNRNTSNINIVVSTMKLSGKSVQLTDKRAESVKKSFWNHFENKCTASTKHGPTVKRKFNTVDLGDSSDSDYYQSNSVVSSDVVGIVNSFNCKTTHATMLIQGQKVQFQLDKELRVIWYLKNICVTYHSTSFVCRMAQPSSLSENWNYQSLTQRTRWMNKQI